MKKNIFTCTLLIAVSAWLSAQNQVTLTFTGKDQHNQHVKLSSVFIENMTKRWQEVLYYPDTVLFTGSTGVQDYTDGQTDFHLFQNVPNPFDGETDFSIQLPGKSDVQLDMFDLNGKVMATYNGTLDQGVHIFKARLATPQTYLLNVLTEGNVLHIKMVNTGHAGQNSLEYAGEGGLTASWVQANGVKSGTLFPFTKGDRMRYIGYAQMEGQEFTSQEVVHVQNQSAKIWFAFTLPVPEVTTNPASAITSSSGTLNGTVNSDNGYAIINRGFVFSDNVGMNNASTYSDGSGTGSFSHVVTNLQPGTQYYYRAYSTSGIGTCYGAILDFKTSNVLPQVTTSSITDITASGATCSGSVTHSGGDLVTRGFCYSTSQNPTMSSSHITCGSGTGGFTGNLIGLMANTTYYVRAYATNNVGTAYGEQLCFTTMPPLLPTLTTDMVSNISATTATCGGNITDDGGSPITARGVCWSTSQNPTISYSHTTNGSGTGSFTSSLTGLTAGTTYYVRAYATNSVGTAYGEQRSFTTINTPTVTTNTVSNISSTSATCGGNVTADGGATVTARGVCWSTLQNPTVSNSHTTNGSGTGSFTSILTGLTAGTIYYVRAYATNSVGTAYGSQVSFTTSTDGLPCSGAATVSDYDGNTYNTVQIGQQCWMKQNLRTTHYANGTSIPAGGSNTSSTDPYYYNYSSSGIALSSRGYLYNWPAVMHGASSSSSNPSGVQGICPSGWHVPSVAEWTQLENYVGSQSAYVCGGDSTYIAKALSSTSGWNSSTSNCAVGNSQSSNNTTGFSAVPVGYCNGSSFNDAGSYAYFWSSTKVILNYNYFVRLYYAAPTAYHGTGSSYFGYYVRCLKD